MVIRNAVENCAFWFYDNYAYIDLEFRTDNNSLTAIIKNQSGTHIKGFNYLYLKIYTTEDEYIGSLTFDIDSATLLNTITIPSEKDIFVLMEFHAYNFDYENNMERDSYWSDSYAHYIYRRHYEYTFDPNGGSGAPQLIYLPCYYVDEGGMVVSDLNMPVKETSNDQYHDITVYFDANLTNAILTKKSQTVQNITRIINKYTLLGWSSSPNATEDEIELEPINPSIYAYNDTTFYAVWSDTSTTKYKSEYGKYNFPTTKECYAEGYTLLGFHYSANVILADYSPGSENHEYGRLGDTYYAVWKPNDGFKVTANGQIIEFSYSDGTFYKLPILTKEGYTFKGWKDSKDNIYTTVTPIRGNEQNMRLTEEWELIDTYRLTVNYYSNGATAHRDLSTKKWKDLDANENVLVNTHVYKFYQTYDDALSDYSGYNEENTDIMRKRGYLPTQYWNTEPDGSGYSFFEIPEKPMTGQEIALELGVDLSSGSTAIDVYAQWKPQTEVYICYEGDKDTIYAGNFIIDDIISINNKGEISAPTFETRINNLAISENGIIAEVFKYGSPDFPYAAEEWNP